MSTVICKPARSVTLDLPPGKLLAAKGVPVRDGVLDLSEAVASDGRLVWRAPILLTRIVPLPRW